MVDSRHSNSSLGSSRRSDDHSIQERKKNDKIHN